MKRINRLYIAVGLALVLTAAAVPATSSASYLESDSTNTTLSGEVSGQQYLAMGGLGVECYSGEIEGFQKPLTAKLAVVEGAYGECGFPSHGSATFKWQNCTATFHMGPKTGSNSYEGTMDLGPSNCGPMTVENTGCQLKIYPRTGMPATYKNIGNGDIAVDLAGTGMKYARTGIMCGNDSGEDGTWSGHWILAGEGEVGGAVNIRVIPESLSKNGSWWVASSYPVSTPGSVTAMNKFRMTPSSLAFYCEKGSVSGTLTDPGFSLPVAVDYGGEKACASAWGSATFTMNGCGYEFDTYWVEIACENPGEVIEIKGYTFGMHVCTITIPAQVLGTVSYENVNRTVKAKITGSGLTSSRPFGASGCGPVSSSEGTFEGSFVLEANG